MSDAKTKQNLRAGLASSVIFIILYLLLDWSFFISILIAIGAFIGVYLINQPVLKIGDVELERIANGEEINQIYLDAKTNVEQLQHSSENIQHSEVSQKALNLASIGQDIMNYLENHPVDISKSRHFLSYYLKTANKILENYLHLKRANISEDKFILITDKTLESLDLLTDIFSKQRDGYHKDKLVDLEVQTELLEKTIKLGGDQR